MTEAQEATKQLAPNDLIGFLDYYLVTKAPVEIPDKVKEWLVKYGPWFLIVSLVFMLPAALLSLGLGAVSAPFAGVGYATGFGFLGLGLLVEFGLTAAALPGLFARKMSGWRLLFYAEVVSGVFRLLGGHIIGAVVVGVFGLYVLLQVRPLYKAS
jgi:hypothetical protein